MQRGYLVLVTVAICLAVCVIPVSAGEVKLGMELAVAPGPVMPGDLLTYTITAENTGDVASPSTIFFDFDPNLEYLSGSPASNQELLGFAVTNPAFWSSLDEPERVIQIGPGGSLVITVTTRVKPGTPCGTSLTSTAEVRDPGNGRPPSSASDSATTAVASCGIPAPEFPSPLIPAAALAGLGIAVLLAGKVERD